jgi:adenylate cyclase
MVKSSKNKSIEDLENQLLLKNKNLNEKYLEIETLLDLTNTINSLDDLESLFFNVLTLSSSIINSSKGIVLIRNEVSNIFDVFSEFNLEETSIKKQILNTRSGFLKKLNKEKKGYIVKKDDDFNHDLFSSKYSLVSPILNNNKLVGAILLFDKESRDGLINFKSNDLKLIDSISIQTSFAYQNIKLLESLKKSNQLNENIMSSITTGIIEINLFGEIGFINKESLRLLNKEELEIIGNHYMIIFENNEQLIEIIQKVEIEQKRIFENEFLLKIGRKKITVNLSCSPVFDDNDSFSGIVIAFDDLSKINKVKSTFKKYVSKNIVDKLLESEDSLNLGGKESDVTILFSDIRGFTSMSEKLNPSEIVKLLNKYFKSMIDVVFKYNGTLDKIVGDELMVLYGVPLKNENDTTNAIKTAIEMFKALDKFNSKIVKEGYEPFRIGIGVNEGKAVSGNIGSDQQMNYTVIGDTINLGARLCSHAKSGEILISKSVKNIIGNEFDFKKIPPINVKGKAKSIDVWSYNHK